VLDPNSWGISFPQLNTNVHTEIISQYVIVSQNLTPINNFSISFTYDQWPKRNENLLSMMIFSGWELLKSLRGGWVWSPPTLALCRHDKLTDDFPRHGWIKCNTDGALISQNQQAGCRRVYMHACLLLVERFLL
jgi:hypothetical protein